MRRFLFGAIWGAIVGVLGLGVVSQLAPVPGGTVAVAPAVAAAPVAEAAAPAVAPEVVTPAPVAEAVVPAVTPAVVTAAPVAEASATNPEAIVTPPAADTAPMAATAPVVAPEVPATLPLPENDGVAMIAAGQVNAAGAGVSAAPLEVPETAPVLAPQPAAPLGQPLADATPTPSAAPAEPPAAPPTEAPMAQVTPKVTGADIAVVAEEPAQLAQADAPEATTQAADALPSPADLPPPPPLSPDEQAVLDAAIAGAVPLDPAPVEASPIVDAAPAPDTLAPAPGLLPDTGLQDAVPTTLTPTPPLQTEGARRLPQVGDVAEPTAAAVPEVTEADLPPLTRYAATFDNPEAKPLFSLVLVDTGAADLDRVTLAGLPFAVSFVVDPLSPGAKAAAEIYRAGGKEVLMLATGIPAGATPADLEQTFQAHGAALPQAVAVIDLADGGFQNDRQLATQLVPILAAQGRGLVTWDRGLNAADQVARRDGLPTAMVFRSLDAEGEDAPVIRRYLDRAAFKAAQEGAVTVVGQTRPETIAALLEWTVEGRASTVALAPVSAVLALR